MASRFAAVSCEHDAEGDACALRCHPVEEVEYSFRSACLVAVPEQMSVGIAEVAVRSVYGEVFCRKYEFAFPLRERRTSPWSHGILEKREVLVGYDKMLVDSHCFSESLAHGACAERIVEVEHLFRRFGKHDSVGLETFREFVFPYVA